MCVELQRVELRPQEPKSGRFGRITTKTSMKMWKRALIFEKRACPSYVNFDPQKRKLVVLVA